MENDASNTELGQIDEAVPVDAKEHTFTDDLPILRSVAAGALVLMAGFGLFAPWKSISIFSKSGIDLTQGAFPMILCLLLIIFISVELLKSLRRFHEVMGLILCLWSATTIIALIIWNNHVNNIFSDGLNALLNASSSLSGMALPDSLAGATKLINLGTGIGFKVSIGVAICALALGATSLLGSVGKDKEEN